MSVAPATLEVLDLRTHFFTKDGVVKAVDGVSLAVNKGEVLGLVGESGSGKTVTGFSVLGLVDSPGRIVGGQIRFQGDDLVAMPHERLRQLRGSKIAMIFQDPMMTLNPVLRIDTQMIEAILAHDHVDRATARQRARDGLGQVGISSPDERLEAYPHQFSGGMRQRVAIAIAFLNKPDLIIADEPTTALDVTIQAQILHEAQKLCRETGTALIWITHDLTVVAGLADRLCVMYAGRIRRRGRHRRGPRRSAASLHQGPDRIGAEPQPARGTPQPDSGNDAVPAASRPGLRVSRALPAGRNRLRPGARDQSTGPGPPNTLLPATSRGGTMRAPELVELHRLSKRFVKPLDLVSRIARRLGANVRARRRRARWMRWT